MRVPRARGVRGTALRVIAPAVKQYRLALWRVVARGAYCGYRWIKPPQPRAELELEVGPADRSAGVIGRCSVKR